jgi:hypothetical protein
MRFVAVFRKNSLRESLDLRWLAQVSGYLPGRGPGKSLRWAFNGEPGSQNRFGALHHGKRWF